MDVFQEYKPLRNKIRLLARDDALRVIWAYSQYLQIDEFQIQADIEAAKEYLADDFPQRWIAEWDLEVLAKEIILNANAQASRGRTLRNWKTLSETVNALKALENSIYSKYGSEKNVLIEVIRIAHRQFVWQGNPPNSTTTMRYYKIFSCDGINQVCLDRLSLTVHEIYACGMAFLGVFMSHPATNLPLQSEIKALPVDTLEKFLTFTCRTLNGLKDRLKSEQQYNENFAYAYSSLRAFPMIQMPFGQNDAVACPLPTLLFWRITGGLYYELLDDPRFSQPFGDSFQGYVGDVINRASPDGNLNVLAEQEYGPKKARKRTVDWIVTDNEGSSPVLAG